MDSSTATATPCTSTPTPMRGDGTQQHHLVSTSLLLQEAGETSLKDLTEEFTMSSLIFHSSLLLVWHFWHNREILLCKRGTLYECAAAIYNLFSFCVSNLDRIQMCFLNFMRALNCIFSIIYCASSVRTFEMSTASHLPCVFCPVSSIKMSQCWSYGFCFSTNCGQQISTVAVPAHHQVPKIALTTDWLLIKSGPYIVKALHK